MMPVLQPEEEEVSGSSAAPSPSVSTPSPSRNKVCAKYHDSILKAMAVNAALMCK